MISVLQKMTFEYLAELFAQYGIEIDFKYDADLDVLNEFRRSVKLRIENRSKYEEFLGRHQTNGKLANTLGLFSRAPLEKNDLFGNNRKMFAFSQSMSKEYKDRYKVEVRSVSFTKLRFDVKIVTDNEAISDQIEMIYLYELANDTKRVSTNIKFGKGIEDLEEVPYTLTFEGITNAGAVNFSNLRTLDFSVTISGMTFLPFTYSKDKLELIKVDLHVMNKTQSLDPKTADDSTKVLTFESIQNKDQ